MQKRAGGTRGGRVGFVVAIVAVLCLGLTAIAVANNLDRRTAQNVAKLAAKRDCQATSGCTGYGASNVSLITHHKARGKIFVNSVKNGTKYQCRRPIVIVLNHETGDIRYFQGNRKCENLGPA